MNNSILALRSLRPPRSPREPLYSLKQYQFLTLRALRPPRSPRELLLSFVLLAFCSMPALSQDDRPMMRGPGAQRVEHLKKLRLQEALKLDEETSIRFFARYNEHQDELRSIGKRRSDAIEELQKLVKKNAPDADIEAQLKTVVAVESEVAATRGKFLEKVKDILKPAQIAQYVVFERNFNQDLREIMRENAQERWRGRN